MGYQIDLGFWKMFSSICFVFALAILWFKTAKTPLYWTAIVLLRTEAALRRLWKSLCVACRDFREGYRDDVEGVASDVMYGYKPDGVMLQLEWDKNKQADMKR